MDNKAKNDLLEDFLKELYEDNSLDDTEKYDAKLKKIYSGDFRHEYSRITKFLVNIDDSESADMLIGKIEDIEGHIEDTQIRRNIDKLKDHITLENIRLSKLRDLADANRNYKNLMDKYDEVNKKLDDITEETKDQVNQSTSQSITILGIFSGIVMAFTGGLSFIASSLQNINAISKYRLLFVLILLAMAVFNTIFMLIYTIGKLTGKYIGSKCNCNDPYSGCCDKDVHCAVVRYPIIIWMNAFCICTLLIIFILYIIDKYNIITYLINIGFWTKCIVIGLIIIVLSIIALIFSLIIKKFVNVECKYEENPGVFSAISQIMGRHFVKKE